ncbi:MAG: DUF3465 domain-containing protein, partial [Phormidesmis sp.]
MKFLSLSAAAVSLLFPAPTIPDDSTITSAIKGYVQADTSGSQQVANAYRNQQSDVMVEDVAGVVEVILSDDLEGSRHQRFIIRIAGGQTVLIVHNIDLAPRIDSLREGDRVS